MKNLTMMMSLKPANMIMFFQKIYGLHYKYKMYYQPTFCLKSYQEYKKTELSLL